MKQIILMIFGIVLGIGSGSAQIKFDDSMRKELNAQLEEKGMSMSIHVIDCERYDWANLDIKNALTKELIIDKNHVSKSQDLYTFNYRKQPNQLMLINKKKYWFINTWSRPYDQVVNDVLSYFVENPDIDKRLLPLYMQKTTNEYLWNCSFGQFGPWFNWLYPDRARPDPIAEEYRQYTDWWRDIPRLQHNKTDNYNSLWDRIMAWFGFGINSSQIEFNDLMRIKFAKHLANKGMTVYDGSAECYDNQNLVIKSVLTEDTISDIHCMSRLQDIYTISGRSQENELVLINKDKYYFIDILNQPYEQVIKQLLLYFNENPSIDERLLLLYIPKVTREYWNNMARRAKNNQDDPWYGWFYSNYDPIALQYRQYVNWKN